MSSPPFSFCVLGSGSRGNASALRTPRGTLLIDCGLSPRETRLRLERAGLGSEPILAMVVTHLDRDHFHLGWVRRLERGDAPPLHLAEIHARRAATLGLGPHHFTAFGDRPFSPITGSEWTPVPFAHDLDGTVGFVIESGKKRLGWATDLGRVPDDFAQRFAGVSALAIESNYDPELQRTSRRHPLLIARIMGGDGHLSNEQSCRAVCAVAATGGLSSVTALHLSQQCNAPRLVRHTYAELVPELLPHLVITSQDSPTPWIAVPNARDCSPTPDVTARLAASRHESTLFGERLRS